MNITAETVQQSCTGTHALDTNVKTILQTVQSHIIESSKNGCTNVIVPVPTNFNIVNMNNKTAQTIIYHRLIKEIEDCGFCVKLIFTKSSVSYHIRWDIKNEESDLNEMRKIIASRVLANNDNN